MADLKISALTASTTPLAGTEVLPIVQSSTTKKVSVSDLTAGRAMSALSGSFGTGTSAYSIGGTQISATNTSANTYLSVYAGAGAATQGGFLIGANNTENQANILWVESGNYLQISANPASSTLRMIAGGATVGTFQSTGLAMPNGLGIDFSATSGTGTSELLADYEEGNWTPIIVGSSSAGTGTYSVQVGTYTKIGNSVFVQMFLIWTAHTGTGDMSVGGLPFTTSSTFLNFSAANIGQFENIALTIGSTPMAIIATSGTTIDLRQMPTGGGAMANVPMDTAGGIILTAAYKV